MGVWKFWYTFLVGVETLAIKCLLGYFVLCLHLRSCKLQGKKGDLLGTIGKFKGGHGKVKIFTPFQLKRGKIISNFK